MKRPRYYLYGLVPALFLHVILWWCGLHTLNLLTSALGFLWPYAMRAPGVPERVQTRAYRYSFLRLSRRVFCALERRSPLAAELSFPLLMGLGLAFFTPFANPAWALLGHACWQLFRWGKA